MFFGDVGGFFHWLLTMFTITRVYIKLDTDRATPGKMLQTGRPGRAFFRRDQEKNGCSIYLVVVW